jgi:hypothetical protein
LTAEVDTSQSKPAPSCDSAVLADAYEQLRRDVVEQPTRTGGLQGLAVLLSKGMAAWISACALAAPLSASTHQRTVRGAATPTLSAMHHELVDVLVGMALNATTELEHDSRE